MTETNKNVNDSILVEEHDKVVAEKSSTKQSAEDLEIVNVITEKNDIKVNEEGVAKLTFGFLDDMQGGDSSLEPGEVKTPPPGSSPAMVKESTPSRLAVEKTPAPDKLLAKETLAKALKTVSQLEAEACEEKVRAILELDAKRHKEEQEKRKLEAEKKRQSGEIDMEVERKRKAKEERRKLKKLKKAKKAAEKALNSDEEDEQNLRKKRKIKKSNESEESEGLCSSGADDDNDIPTSSNEKHSSILNSAIAIPTMPPTRYPPHLPHPHLLSEAFMGGFRPMNPFMRGPRPDFGHGGRGGFIPRGRGGMRGRMPFQGFRPPFFANAANSGGPLKFNVPHGLQQQQQHQQRPHHTPPPNRGHSPILPPTSDLQWTKCKPSISYAFKYNKEQHSTKFHGAHNDIKPHSSNRIQSEENWDDSQEATADGQKTDDYKHDQMRRRDKKHKSLTKDKKKTKKHKSKDVKKSKRSRTSLSSSATMLKQKKKSSKSSRRKIEKIRKSYGSNTKTSPNQQQNSSEDTEAINENAQNECEHDKKCGEEEEESDKERMPNEEEIRNKVENIKREKIETTELKIEDLTLKVKPLIMIKTEPHDKEKDKEKLHPTTETTKAEVEKTFDIFAESPPPSEVAAKSAITENANNKLKSVTPPLPVLNETKVQKTSLQNALEIQKRIDKLLQQDDIKLEAIEAAKDLLIKKAQKYQSTKEKVTPERDLNKATIEQKFEKASENTVTKTSLKEESLMDKEKPKAYKDKEVAKKTDKEMDKDKEKIKDKSKESFKYKDEKDLKLKEKSSFSTKDKTRETEKDERKTKIYEKEKDRESPRSKEMDKARKESASSSSYRNPFKRSLSRDKYFGKIDSRRRTRTKSRERDFSTKRRLSHDRKRGDSSGYSSSRISSKRRISGSSSASTILNRSKSGERDIKGSLDSLSINDKERKDKKRDKSPETRNKRKRSITPKRRGDKEKDLSSKTKSSEKEKQSEIKSITSPPKSKRTENKSSDTQATKEPKKSKSPVKAAAPKRRPLSFTQTEFLFPEDGNDDDFILGDDEETNDSFKNLKSPSDKEDSPDTDDYMDNWENDEDVDLDMNSNMPNDMSTPRKSSPDLTEEDSFVTRFANPSPPHELLLKQSKLETESNKEKNSEDSQPLTPPLDLLKNLPQSSVESTDIKTQESIKQPPKDNTETKKPQLFGMQELYDQFIKSVEASGVNIKTANKEQTRECQEVFGGEKKNEEISSDIINETQNQSEDPLSTSSTSTSSSNSSSTSSSSESNSSSNTSSSSSSDSSSEDSNDESDKFKQSTKQKKKKKIKIEDTKTINDSLMLDKPKSPTEIVTAKSPPQREPRTPSPSPMQKNLLITPTPPTPTTQNKAAPKTDVAKDFKKLKNLEANLSRIQMMRANYDSNDEISEELHKMEMLFLQEKKIILQKYAKNTQTPEKVAAVKNIKANADFVPILQSQEFGVLPPPPPPEEPNKIFDANREAIKLTISPLKLPSKPAIFNVALNEETEKKAVEEEDFTEKLVKPAKEVAIVKPMMETKESKESRSRETHRHRRSPVYGGSRERQRSPANYRDRNRRSTSRNRFSPQRRGRGRSLSISPPRRGVGGLRHGTPPRRGVTSGRFRVTNRRSRSRSRSPLRQFGNRRGKEGSPFRRKRGSQQDMQSHYKKFGRHRGSRSRSPRSPQIRPRSPRTPPTRRRSYSPDPYSRSPLPFKPPSPPMRRSMSPPSSPSSPTRRSRSPPSPRRPRSPRSPQSPLSPRSPRSPRSPDSPPSRRYEDHRYRRDNSFERHTSMSPHPQYYTSDPMAGTVPQQASSYYYNVSPNRISLDARINIVLNTPGGGAETPPAGYEGYTNYAQYGGAAYMTIPPQPMTDPSNSMGYYPNPYVPLMHPGPHDPHHAMAVPNPHALHPHPHTGIPSPHLQQQPHSPAYSTIPTINSGVSGPASPLPPNNFYYNDFNMTHQPSNPVLKELPKASVAVQKGNVLEIVPSNVEATQQQQQQPPQVAQKTRTSPLLVETLKSHLDKISSISWKDEVNNRHVKSAVMRLNRGGDNVMRSILKKSEAAEKADKCEKKKVYFEDGIYPSRDSDDEDRKLIEYKIRKKVLRLRKKRNIDVPAAKELVDEKFKQKVRKPKIDAALEKLPPPPPPAAMPPANLEQPIYLRPPTPVPLVYFHFDSVVHSMYVSQLEKPIPPRLLNPKCVPPGVGPGPPGSSVNSGAGVGVAPSTSININHSPNLNIPSASAASKKELTTLAALNRVGRNENLLNSPKIITDTKRESPTSQQSPHMSINKVSGLHFTPTQSSPQMSPLHGPPLRHNAAPMGFVGMRVNNFMRLPPSPLTRAAIPPHMQPPPSNMPNLPPGAMMGMRHPQYNMPPPNLMPPEGNYSGNGTPAYGTMQTPTPPGFHNYGQRPMNTGFFMGANPAHTMHPPPHLTAKDKEHMQHQHQFQQHQQQQHQHHHTTQGHLHPQQGHHHSQQHIQQKPPPPLPPPVIASSNVVTASPKAMIAPFNVKKTVN